MNAMLDDFDIEIVCELTEGESVMANDKIYIESVKLAAPEVIYAR